MMHACKYSNCQSYSLNDGSFVFFSGVEESSGDHVSLINLGCAFLKYSSNERNLYLLPYLYELQGGLGPLMDADPFKNCEDLGDSLDIAFNFKKNYKLYRVGSTGHSFICKDMPPPPSVKYVSIKAATDDICYLDGPKHLTAAKQFVGSADNPRGFLKTYTVLDDGKCYQLRYNPLMVVGEKEKREEEINMFSLSPEWHLITNVEKLCGILGTAIIDAMKKEANFMRTRTTSELIKITWEQMERVENIGLRLLYAAVMALKNHFASKDFVSSQNFCYLFDPTLTQMFKAIPLNFLCRPSSGMDPCEIFSYAFCYITLLKTVASMDAKKEHKVDQKDRRQENEYNDIFYSIWNENATLNTCLPSMVVLKSKMAKQWKHSISEIPDTHINNLKRATSLQYGIFASFFFLSRAIGHLLLEELKQYSQLNNSHMVTNLLAFAKKDLIAEPNATLMAAVISTEPEHYQSIRHFAGSIFQGDKLGVVENCGSSDIFLNITVEFVSVVMHLTCTELYNTIEQLEQNFSMVISRCFNKLQYVLTSLSQGSMKCIYIFSLFAKIVETNMFPRGTFSEKNKSPTSNYLNELCLEETDAPLFIFPSQLIQKKLRLSNKSEGQKLSEWVTSGRYDA